MRSTINCRVVVVGMLWWRMCHGVDGVRHANASARSRSGPSHVSFLAARHIFAGGKEGN